MNGKQENGKETRGEMSKDEATDGKQLPPLSDHDFRVYNHLADRMDQFHNHFRQTWDLLWDACCAGRRPRDMTLRQFIDEGIKFAEYLTAHHSIEEQYVFPMLAKRMPEFDPRRGDLLAQHKQIHAGLDAFEAYLRGCKAREVEFELGVLKEKMAPWREVLWTHLDEEVKSLGAENMRKYWTKEEIRRLPM